VCAVAAVLAASKMAVATIGVAYALLIAVAIAVGQGRKRIVLIVGTAIVAVALSVVAMAGPLRGRLADFAATHSGSVSQSTRGFAWAAALRLAGDYPVTGSGFGALADVLHAYLPRGEGGYWGELHNDFLEVYVAGGLIAVVLVVWLTVTYLARIWRVVLMDTASARLLPTLGIIAGLAALAVHEFVDFNLQIPANALLFVVMAAMCVSPRARSVEGP
jgi:O-antigen ligase